MAVGDRRHHQHRRRSHSSIGLQQVADSSAAPLRRVVMGASDR